MPNYVIGLDLGARSVKAAVLKGAFRGYEVEDFLSVERRAAPSHAPSDALGATPATVEFDPSRRDDDFDGDATLPPGAQVPVLNGDSASTDDAAPPRLDRPADLNPAEEAALADLATIGGIPAPVGGAANLAIEGAPAAHGQSDISVAIRSILDTIRQPQALVVASVPAERVSNWLIDLPFSDKKRIDSTIEFEVENYVPWDLDDVVLDYQIVESSPDGARVFAAMVPKDRLEELLTSLTEGGADPKHVTVDAAELARLVEASDDGEAILDIGASRTLICIVQNGLPRWIRSIDRGLDPGPLAEGPAVPRFGPDSSNPLPPVDDDLRAWLRALRSSLLASEQGGAPEIERVLLTGGGSRRPGLQALLEDRLGVPAEPLQLPASVVNPDTAPRPEPEHALCYALALRAFAGKGEGGVDFRKGPYAYKVTSQLYTRLGFVAIAAMVLLTIGGIAMHFVTLGQLKGQLDDATGRLSQQVIQKFPTVSPGALGTPDASIAVMQEKVYALQSQVEALKGYDMGSLDALKELSETVPPSITVDVSEYLVNQEMIRFRGETDSFGSVDKIEAAVVGNPKFRGAQKSDVNKARDGKMRFVVTIPRVPPEEEVEG